MRALSLPNRKVSEILLLAESIVRLCEQDAPEAKIVNYGNNLMLTLIASDIAMNGKNGDYESLKTTIQLLEDSIHGGK